jgi:hypothetical protein
MDTPLLMAAKNISYKHHILKNVTSAFKADERLEISEQFCNSEAGRSGQKTMKDEQ